VIGRCAIRFGLKAPEGTAVKRRAFITLIGGVAAWPLAAPAQSPGKLVRIGFLSGGSEANSNIAGFRQGLRQIGYIEGQNLLMIYRWAAGRPDRLVDLASELLESNVDLLASHTTEAITAIRSLNATIPVVMTAGKLLQPTGMKSDKVEMSLLPHRPRRMALPNG
jgi:putative tryptophan/tyrosine transport system substrate-binding protein